MSVSYPSLGVTVIVTLLPFEAESLSSLIEPFSVSLSAVISFLLYDEELPLDEDEPPVYDGSLSSVPFL